MNKRANIYLNIYSIVLFLLGLSLLGITITLNDVTFTFPIYLKYITFILGTVTALLTISIELFLFILLTTKYKIIDIIYIILIGIIAIYLNTIFPFIGFLIIIVIPISKIIFRITLVDKIYIPKEFNHYCKMMNIKIKDFPKKRKPKKEIKTEIENSISIEEDANIEIKPKKKKKTVKSYS